MEQKLLATEVFGISSAAAGTALTYGMIGGGYLSLAGSTAFAADQTFAIGSGESVLLNTVFDGKQDAYDTAFMVCDMLTMGYMDMCMQYRMTCGSQTANSADDTTDETRQGNKNNVNMDASGNNSDDTNGTGPKNAKTSTNTAGNAADDAETSGTSGKKSGVYLEEGEAYEEKAKVSYDRPSGYRKGVREKVWENAKNADGEVRDPITNKVMNPNEPWDMGHKPGYEFRKHKQSAQQRGISRKQFLDEHNNPEHYRPELPSSNRSHVGEDVTDKYFGP